jgi:hypothetical protein
MPAIQPIADSGISAIAGSHAAAHAASAMESSSVLRSKAPAMRYRARRMTMKLAAWHGGFKRVPPDRHVGVYPSIGVKRSQGELLRPGRDGESDSGR